MLTEYQYAAKGKLDVEHVDPERNLSRAKELFDKYKVVSDESLIILDYDGRNKTVKASEMAEVDQGNPMFGEPPKITAFKGEQAITERPDRSRRGEEKCHRLCARPQGAADRGGPPTSPMQRRAETLSPISLVKTVIENENIKFQELNLFEVSEIPADLKTILINGPQYDFSDREMKLLRDFWEKQGRILLLLDPSAKTPKLHRFPE